MTDIMEPTERLAKPIVDIKSRLLCGAGPSNMSPRVFAASLLPQLAASPVEPQMYELMADIRDGIRYAFQTRTQWALCITGPGNSAMEATCCSLLEAGERFLIVRIGFFGYKMGLIASRHDLDIKTISKPIGEVFNMEELEQAISEFQPKAIYVAHGETSTGVVQPIEGLGSICHRYGCLLVVDAIASLGVVPFYMDKWEIDVAFTAQKVLGGLTGISSMALSDAAWTKMTTRKTAIRCHFLDVTLLVGMWGCIKNEVLYQHSPGNSNIYTLREGLACLADEGLESVWARHRHSTQILHEGLEKLGLTFIAKEPVNRLPSITAVRLPSDLIGKGELIRKHMIDKYGVIISPGLFAKDTSEDRNSAIRVATMGYNARVEVAERLLAALSGTLEAIRNVDS